MYQRRNCAAADAVFFQMRSARPQSRDREAGEPITESPPEVSRLVDCHDQRPIAARPVSPPDRARVHRAFRAANLRRNRHDCSLVAIAQSVDRELEHSRYAAYPRCHAQQIIYPRPQNLTDNARASIHEGRFRRRLGVRIGGGGLGWVQHAHPHRGGRSRTVPARHPRVAGALGDMPYRRRCRAPSCMSRPQQRWLGVVPEEEGTEPEMSVHRGSCGAGLKHRARDAGEMADLRSSKSDEA